MIGWRAWPALTAVQRQRLETALTDSDLATSVAVSWVLYRHCVTIDAAVGHLLDREAVLCTDGSIPVSVKVVGTSFMRLLILAQGIRVRRPTFQFRNVNAHHGCWKRWVDRFPGGITRYLTHYLGWHRMLD